MIDPKDFSTNYGCLNPLKLLFMQIIYILKPKPEPRKNEKCSLMSKKTIPRQEPTQSFDGEVNV